MFEAFFAGLFLIFQWPAFGFLLVGIFIGIWFGAVPGLGGVTGLVILLPFTFDMDAVSAFALLLGMYAVTSTSDTIASVMLGIPGTAASQATILDGHPLARMGHAARAFGAAFTVSAFGGIFGALVLAITLPLVLPIILAFASPELFMLGVLGLSMIGSLSGGSILKGLTIASLGLLISTIGYAESTAIPRYWFGANYLLDGLPLIPVVLGLFAIPEVMELATHNSSISKVPKEQATGGQMLKGIKDVWLYRWLAIRCSVIGTYIGMLPGIGDSIVDWVAYGHAVQSTKDSPQFGKGDIRGVIAPEAANNATKGGALIPTVAFGIPGSVATAILLGAFLIQGLKPGTEMLTDHLDLTFSMVWTIVVANILAAGLLMIWSKQVAKVSFVPGHFLVPGVIVTVFMGAWLGGASIGDWVACFLAGILGYIMKKSGWPRPPLILAIILGTIMENSFVISVKAYDGYSWLGRPIVLAIIAIILITIYLAARKLNIEPEVTDNVIHVGEGREKNPVFSFPFSAVLIVLFGWAIAEALGWPKSVRQFPVAVAIPGLLFSILAFVADSKNLYQEVHDAGGKKYAIILSIEKASLLSSTKFFAFLLLMIVMMLFVGQKIVLPSFVLVYLVVWAGYSWKLALGYAVAVWFVLIVFYDRILQLFWHQSWLAEWLPSFLPNWFPSWLVI